MSSFSEKPKFSTRYQYSYVPMLDVINDIDEYIIPELQEACKSLWERNIYTFMCSNRDDNGEAYICLELLSEENMEIFESLKSKHPKNYMLDGWRGNRVCILIKDVTLITIEEISSAFLNLVKDFKMQDVQKDFYVTKEAYLISNGAYDEIPNPNYKENVDSLLNFSSLEEVEKWLKQCREPQTIKVFNKNKMTKSFEEYVKENNDLDKTDLKLGRVYCEPYFLQRHLEYIELKKADIVGI